jgi:hypothetical protein
MFFEIFKEELTGYLNGQNFFFVPQV